MNGGDQAAVIGAGAVVLMAVSAGAWRAAAFRGDLNTRWAGRVAFAVAALDEKLVAGLQELREKIEEFLPEGQDFDPSQVIADPAPLTELASEVARNYRARVRMESDLVRLRNLGPPLVALLVVLAVDVADLTLYYGDIVGGSLFRVLGLVVGAGSIVAIAVAFGTYVVLQQRLSTAEILAGTAGRATPPPS